MNRATAWAIVCAALIATTAVAQVQRSGGGSGAANAQLMMQYQQASTERAQLQADNTKLKKDLEDLKKQLDASNKQAAASKAGVSRDTAQLAAAQAANDRTSKDLADSKAKMQELIGKFRETITQMRGVESERAQLQQQLADSKVSFDKCVERNYQLYQVNNEVLDRYSHEGAFSHMAKAEPFTRIKRTQIDNYVLEYKERAEELRLQKAGPPAGGAPPTPAAPAAPASPGPRGAASGGPAATGAATPATAAAAPQPWPTAPSTHTNTPAPPAQHN